MVILIFSYFIFFLNFHLNILTHIKRKRVFVRFCLKKNMCISPELTTSLKNWQLVPEGSADIHRLYPSSFYSAK